MIISGKSFINYAVLPGLRPRFQDLFATGFQHIPFFMALIYQAVRLLPTNHPYTNPANLGRFGIRHVIAEAANSLVFSHKNIDQIIVFATLLIGMGIIFVQVALLGISIFAGPAMAGIPDGWNFTGFFKTPDATRPQDLAHIFMDLVFGVPEMFQSCVDTSPDGPNVPCEDSDGHIVSDTSGNWILAPLGWPFPLHYALHEMFRLYSIGLLIIATMITTYFIATILAETAQTGQAFGKRFNKVWALPRIVIAFGLLVPLNIGLNSSQYIVLYAAKFGSGFATNGWNIFNETLSNNNLAQLRNMLSEDVADTTQPEANSSQISRPNPPEIGGLLQFMYVARTCESLEELKNDDRDLNTPYIRPYLVKDPRSPRPYLEITSATDYRRMIDFVDGDKQAIIRFGIQDDKEYKWQRGTVDPICGELILPLNDPRKPASSGPVGPPNPNLPPPNYAEPGSIAMQDFYWRLIYQLWESMCAMEFDEDGATGVCDDTIDYAWNTAKRFSQWATDPNARLPGPEYRSGLQAHFASDLEEAITDAIDRQVRSNTWVVEPALQAKGWAGAGIWYNKIAEMNGAMTSAILNIPFASRYPKVMEYVKYKKQQQDMQINVKEMFMPDLAPGDDIKGERPEDPQMAGALWVAYNYWQSDGQATTSHTSATGNAFIDAVNALFGTEGLYNIRRNKGVHPLAQVVGIGRSLVEGSIRSFTFAIGTSIGGAGLSFIDNFFGAAASVGVGFFMTVATVGLTVGFVLYYIVPFLPFIYFFFAVGGWVKGIFEAMVGAPLWALAHIRIDGEGLPGQAAINGYFLIFEIFLRPILIVFGLLASISIFAALVSILNETWDLVTKNLTGYDVRNETGSFRNSIDQVFFTVIYAILIYLMGMSSFKLIDLIPNNILRWMGSNIETFNDAREDPAESLVGTGYIGSQQVLQEVGGGVKGALQQVSTLGSRSGG